MHPQLRIALHLFVTSLWLIATTAQADRTDEATATWKPWAEIGAIGSSGLSYGEFALFVPRGNETTLGFLDLRAKAFADFDNKGDDAFEGNFAGGLRHMIRTPFLGQAWNAGAWVGADLRRSPSKNKFWQVSTGLELLSADWDVRANAYIPLNDPKDASPDRIDIRLESGRLLMEGGQEVPLYGVDAELGVRVPIESSVWARRGLGHDVADHVWRVYVGGFYFDENDHDVDQGVVGPRIRSEWRVVNAIPGFPAARLTLSFEFQWDEVREEQWAGGVRMRIPIEWNTTKSKPRTRSSLPDERQRRIARMTERIFRDVDIVVGETRRESVDAARTGVRLADVTIVDGETEDPQSVIESAGVDSVIMVDGEAGPIELNDGVQLQVGQALFGGGLEVRGSRSGAKTTFGTPAGIRGGAAGALIDAASDVTISRITLLTDGNTIDAIRITSAANVRIDGVGITTTGSDAVGINASFSDVSIARSLIETTGSDSHGIRASTSSRVTLRESRVVTSAQGATGVALTADAQLTATELNIETDGESAYGVEATGDSVLQADHLTISTRGRLADGARVSTGSATLDSTRIETRGHSAHGLAGTGSGYDIEFTNSRVETSGSSASGLFGGSSGTMVIRNSHVVTTGEATDGVELDENVRFTMYGGTVSTDSGRGIMASSSAGDEIRLLIEDVGIDSVESAIRLDGALRRAGTISATLTDNDLSSPSSTGEILAISAGTSTIVVNASGNRLDDGDGGIWLWESAGTISLSQDAPDTGADGIDAQNGIPAASVVIPAGAIDYNVPAPPLP